MFFGKLALIPNKAFLVSFINLPLCIHQTIFSIFQKIFFWGLIFQEMLSKRNKKSKTFSIFVVEKLDKSKKNSEHFCMSNRRRIH